jgi:hypothetical protein
MFPKHYYPTTYLYWVVNYFCIPSNIVLIYIAKEICSVNEKVKVISISEKIKIVPVHEKIKMVMR